MLSLVSIKKAIVSKLKILNINSIANDIRSGFEKPAFFIQLMPISNTTDNEVQERTITVNIHYFSEGKTDLENLKMEDKLNCLFVNSLKVEDRVLTLYDKRSETDENILQFKFDLIFTENRPIGLDEQVEEYETMERLELKL